MPGPAPEALLPPARPQPHCSLWSSSTLERGGRTQGSSCGICLHLSTPTWRRRTWSPGVSPQMEDMPLGVQESPPPTWRTWLGNPGYQPPAPEGQSSHLENMALGIQESGSPPGGPGVTPPPGGDSLGVRESAPTVPKSVTGQAQRCLRPCKASTSSSQPSPDQGGRWLCTKDTWALPAMWTASPCPNPES